ncbi:hypothetical protein PV328_005814 [Microctonus aethiopoides]|uniref:Uncharacterized protein n=1 Tax=Microctonus aethiopoides TaxID=144406 RepID=A0AA39FN60_9HYME|nr:hypothetical protein PV328_005814 [Microctonus aethiopoides]
MLEVIKKSDSDEEGMDSPMDTEISVTLEEPKRKRLRQFNKAWLQDPIFKDWLKSSPNGDRALCSICDGDLFNSRSALLHHVTSMRHTDNYKIRYGKRPSASVDESKTISDVKLKMRLETLKMELSAFFAKRDVQIAIVDDLIPLLDRFYYGSKLLDKYVKTKKESTKITVKSSEERTPDYQWVEYMPKLWNETRLVFLINNTYFSFVIARILYDNGDKIPSAGKIFSRNRTIVFNHEKNTSDHKLEVLLINRGRHVWIESSNGTVEKNAIVGGTKGNETIYLCQVKPSYTGWMQPSKRGCNVHYGNESYENYKLLIHDKMIK